MASLRAQQNKKARDAQKPKIEAMIAEGRIQDVIDGLSVRQRRFCEEYLIDFCGVKAVARAGYSTKHANRMAYQLLKNPAVKACIDQLTLQKASDSVIKPEYVIQKVTKTIEKAESDGNHTAVLRGCELLARHLGMFIERTEISGPNGEAIKYEKVREAADAFTSAIAGLIERGGADEAALFVESRG